MDDPWSLLENARHHKGWGGAYKGGQSGFSEPNLAHASLYYLSDANRSLLLERGIEIFGQHGDDCFICLANEASKFSLRINLHGHSRSKIFLGHTTSLHGQISLEGDNHLLIFSGSSGHNRINATFRGDNSAIFFGSEATAVDVDLLAQGRSIQIGDDALISFGVHVLTSDSHAIIDLDIDYPRQTNKPRSVIIEPHVWLCAYAIIQKGVNVGQGAIVATNSVVTKDVPPRTIYAGIPARLIRDRVTWSRDAVPDDGAIMLAVNAATKR